MSRVFLEWEDLNSLFVFDKVCLRYILSIFWAPRICKMTTLELKKVIYGS